jgi:hypothetical protein
METDVAPVDLHVNATQDGHATVGMRLARTTATCIDVSINAFAERSSGAAMRGKQVLDESELRAIAEPRSAVKRREATASRQLPA